MFQKARGAVLKRFSIGQFGLSEHVKKNDSGELCIPVVPVLVPVPVPGSRVPGQHGLHSEILSQKKEKKSKECSIL